MPSLQRLAVLGVVALALQSCSPPAAGPDAGEDAGRQDAGPPDSGTPIPDAGKPPYCVGGFITADGGCVGKCTPDKCLPGNTCVNNVCTLKCNSHLECLLAQRCSAGKEDDSNAEILICTDYPFRGVGNPCPGGVSECVAGFECITSGPADALAYCASDCLADADCPGGFECGYKRDPRLICGTTKGNNNTCGKTTSPCFPRASITPDSGYVEGTLCLQRRVCLKRSVCSPCSGNVDCSLLPANTCVPLGAEKRCAAACATNTDCEADKYCDQGFCTPMAGKCSGSGFCSPCRYDIDCEPAMSCVSLHGSEKSCIDLTLSKTCTADTDCPEAPSGLNGACLDQRHNVASNNAAFHRCYAPYDETNSAFSCYIPR